MSDIFARTSKRYGLLGFPGPFDSHPMAYFNAKCSYFFYSPLAAPSGHRNFHKKRSSNNFLFRNKSLSWARKDFARSWPPTTDDDRNIFALKCFGSLSQGYAIYAWKHPAFMAPQLYWDHINGTVAGANSSAFSPLVTPCYIANAIVHIRGAKSFMLGFYRHVISATIWRFVETFPAK